MTWTLASRFRTLVMLAALGGLAFVLPSSASSQERPLVTPDDYGRWERLGGVEFSPLGDWIAYEVTRVDETSELRVRRIEEDSARVFPWGSEPRFSPDGRWLAWTIGLPPEERERLAESDEPVREKASVMDLETGGIREFEAVSEGRFDASGRYVALRGYSPDEPSGKGADLRIVTLATGAETSFGNVSEMAWSPGGSLLALAIATGADVGNGVQVYDADAGILRSADASGSSYRSLRWRDDSADLAALRSREAASADGAAYDVLAWRGLDRGVETMVLGADAAGIPDTLEAVRHRAPAWSDDGHMISLGLRPIEPEAMRAADDEPEDGDPATMPNPTFPACRSGTRATSASSLSRGCRRTATPRARCSPSGTSTTTGRSSSGPTSWPGPNSWKAGRTRWRTSASPTRGARCSAVRTTTCGRSTRTPVSAAGS
ncbi:hypothetical protein [Candidatus Palauibacter irciniicola]|uniref:hypothetical protein n=1 Tax=Candidatus Palauibacter irciniicola TaxID=3056733 RepID=UPI003B027D56